MRWIKINLFPAVKTGNSGYIGRMGLAAGCAGTANPILTWRCSHAKYCNL